jgi:hypothetical protein
MKKEIILLFVVFLCVSVSGCLGEGSRRVVISGTITDMKYHSVGWSGLDTVYDMTIDNESVYMVRSGDFKEYDITVGDFVKLELWSIGGGGSYYYIHCIYELSEGK